MAAPPYLLHYPLPINVQTASSTTTMTGPPPLAGLRVLEFAGLAPGKFSPAANPLTLHS